MVAELTYQRCPECGRTVPADRRYMTWCEHCDWNVDPTGERREVPAWRTRLETRLADSLYRELERGRIQRPGWDLARVTANLLSLLVLLIPIACLALGIFALLSYRPLWLAIAIAAVAFGAVVVFTPRPPGLPRDACVLGPDDAPVLFRTLDAIAGKLGTAKVYAVVVDEEPNIWFGRFGWARRPVVGIGLPLWLGLGPQERVAILAHELGHGRNGDAGQGLLLGGAEGVLDELLRTFHAQPLDDFRRDLGYHPNAGEMEATVNTATRIVNATVGGLVRAYAGLLNRVAMRGSQRAEYLADRAAATVAGSEATANALERLTLAETAHRALERALRYEPDADPVAAVRRAVTEIPKRELERRLRVSRLRETRIDGSHPPTYLRAKLVRAQPVPVAAVVLGSSEAAVTDAELMRTAGPVLRLIREG